MNYVSKRMQFFAYVLCIGLCCFVVATAEAQTTYVPFVKEGEAPELDGSCGAEEYTSAVTIPFPSHYNPTNEDFKRPVYLLRTPNHLYVCLTHHSPLFNATDITFELFLDRTDEGVLQNSIVLTETFGTNSPTSATYNRATNDMTGGSVSGWDVARNEYGQSVEFPASRSIEYKIDRATVGGWQGNVGFAMRSRSLGGSGNTGPYSEIVKYPDVNLGNPASWATLNLRTENIIIGKVIETPLRDGDCETDKYGASIGQFASSDRTVTVYAVHTNANLYVCLAGLKIPAEGVQDGPNAAIYISPYNPGADAAGADDMRFTLSYNNEFTTRRGDGYAWGGPSVSASAERDINRLLGITPISWDAEFVIPKATIGGELSDRQIVFGAAQQWVQVSGDDYGWPESWWWRSPNTYAIATLSSNPAPAVNDVSAEAIEVVQTIQDVDNSVTLIADKRTFARVHVSSSNSATSQIEARLRGYIDGELLAPALIPLNPGADISVVPDPDRGNINDSFLFELPASWIVAGDLQLVAEINPYREIQESSYVNNEVETNVSFVDTKPLNLRIIDFQYELADGTDIQLREIDQDLLESQIRRMYPLDELITERRTFFDGSIHSTPDADYVNSCLNWSRNTYDGGGSGWKYYGYVYSPPFMRGKADGIPSTVSSGPGGPNGLGGWDTDASFGDWYGTHEIGHSLGRSHAEFCGAGGGSSYPYPNGIIGGPSAEQDKFYGFDAGDAGNSIAQRVIPNTWTDNMTYCNNQWISDRNYHGIHSSIQANNVPSLRSAGVGETVSVFGMIDLTTGMAEIPFVSQQSNASSFPVFALNGTHEIVLFDESDTELSTHLFTPSNDPSDDDATTASIGEIVPWVSETRRIAVRETVSGKEIASRKVSANKPLVTNVEHFSIVGRGHVLTWDSADSDGDMLEYTILYSHDSGSNWRTLATMVMDTNYDVSNGEIEGTDGKVGLFRIVVNDGVLTTYADTDLFTVQNKTPDVDISSPANNAVYGYGQLVALEGHGQDFEDGTLADSRLSWSSDVDGNLGTGSLVHASLLSVGKHQLTLTARDSTGATSTSSVTVFIQDRPVEPENGFSVGPDSLAFQAEVGTNPATQTVSVRSMTDMSIDWTASTDVSWATLSKTSGTSPDKFMVQIDTTGFRMGSVHSTVIKFVGDGGEAAEIPIFVQMLGDVTPDVNIIPSTTSGEAPLTVTFDNQSTGNIVKYLFDYGDGSPLALTTPLTATYTFNNPGTYVMKVTGSSPYAEMDTQTISITVTDSSSVQRGDVNCNGTVNLIDIVLLKQYDAFIIAGTTDCDEVGDNEKANTLACDMNMDNRCSLVDGVIIQQCNAFIPNAFCP